MFVVGCGFVKFIYYIDMIIIFFVQPISNYAMAYQQQPGMVGLPTAIPGAQSDLTTYAPMQQAAYPFGGQQYQIPYQAR